MASVEWPTDHWTLAFFCIMSLKDWWYRLKGSPVSDVIKRKHRFVVMDTDTFKEKFSFQLSGINLFVAIGITVIVLIILTTVLIAFTPLREWIPGYTDNAAVEQTYANSRKLDSLQVQLENQEWHMYNSEDHNQLHNQVCNMYNLVHHNQLYNQVCSM